VFKKVKVDNTTTEVKDNTAQHDPFFVVHCTLRSADGLHDRNLISVGVNTAAAGSEDTSTASTSPAPDDASSTVSSASNTALPVKTIRVLMGNLVSSPCVLDDEFGKEGTFFYFPDLSVRIEGQFRLRFALMQLDDAGTNTTSETGSQFGFVRRILAECMSDVFTVYSAKRFPGMKESSELTKAFARQGLKIPVRNETRVRRDRNDAALMAPAGASLSTSPPLRAADKQEGSSRKRGASLDDAAVKEEEEENQSDDKEEKSLRQKVRRKR